MPLTITDDNNKEKKQHFRYGTVNVHSGTFKIVFQNDCEKL